MPPLRRSNDRRRRVLYQTHTAPDPSQSPRRRNAESLRAARQPAKVFGSRVRQPLRGRWFSLVPVSTFSLTMVVATLVTVPLVLTALHYLAITWPTLAYREALARPFRIDFRDSFASWWLSAVLLLSTATSLLIYQLRRHRSDDYRGHYRLWRLTMCVMFVIGISSTVGLLSWFGALVDLVVGDRAALSGERWLRILVDVAGIILTMRLVAEVYRCRAALVPLLAGAALIGYAEAAVWNLVAIDNAFKSTLVIAAPLLGFSAFLIASTSYLRLLYRQARNIDDAAPLRQRIRDWATQTFARDDEPIAELEEVEFARPNAVAVIREDETAPTRRRSRTTRAKPSVAKQEPSAKTETQTQPKPTKATSPQPQAEQADEETPKTKRGWFGRRKPQVTEDQGDAEPEVPASAEAEPDKPKKRGLFSMRLRPKEAPEEESVTEGETEPTAKPKRGLGGFLRRKDAAPVQETEADASPDSGSANRTATRTAESATSAASANEELDPDDIDWDSMSKSERRRLRKKLRRGGHAA
ncbi:MAG: hypothetical protein AAFX06_01520 [Planctomycetota bacterium]